MLTKTNIIESIVVLMLPNGSFMSLDLTVGQNCGEMLAETGSFDVLFWYWVLGIGYSGIYIHIYVYIYIEYWVLGYIHICTHIYILRMEDEVILHGQSS